MTVGIQRFLKSTEKRILAHASCAVAAQLPNTQLLDDGCTAQLLDDGNTAQSAHNIQVSSNFKNIRNNEANSILAHVHDGTHLITYDEPMMTHHHNWEPVDRKICIICRSTLVLAGIAVLYFEYFQWSLLVVREKNRSQIISSSFKHSRLYFSFKCFRLYTNMQFQPLARIPAQYRMHLTLQAIN